MTKLNMAMHRAKQIPTASNKAKAVRAWVKAVKEMLNGTI